MNNIQILENTEFNIRVMRNEQGEPLFCLNDVCKAQGYTNPQKALRDHVVNEDKLGERIVLSGQNRYVTFINKSGALLPKSEASQQRYEKTEYYLRKHTARNQLIS